MTRYERYKQDFVTSIHPRISKALAPSIVPTLAAHLRSFNVIKDGILVTVKHHTTDMVLNLCSIQFYPGSSENYSILLYELDGLTKHPQCSAIISVLNQVVFLPLIQDWRLGYDIEDKTISIINNSNESIFLSLARRICNYVATHSCVLSPVSGYTYKRRSKTPEPSKILYPISILAARKVTQTIPALTGSFEPDADFTEGETT